MKNPSVLVSTIKRKNITLAWYEWLPFFDFFEFCHLEELTQQNPQASLNTTKMHKDWRLLSVVLIGVHSKRCCRVALFLANLAGVAHVHVLGLNVLFQVVLLLECAEAGAALPHQHVQLIQSPPNHAVHDRIVILTEKGGVLHWGSRFGCEKRMENEREDDCLEQGEKDRRGREGRLGLSFIWSWDV